MATLRARLTGVPYGDQVLFVRSTYFRRLQGYRRLPILEDVEFIQRVKQHGGRVCILPEKVRTSVRRLQQEGIMWCLVRNLVLVGLYHLGVSARTLARYYPALRPPPRKKTVADPASIQR